jgi:hypothetical protein
MITLISVSRPNFFLFICAPGRIKKSRLLLLPRTSSFKFMPRKSAK